MTLDHSELYLQNKFLKTNQAEFFAVDKYTLENLAKQIRGCVNHPFILFTHHI